METLFKPVNKLPFDKTILPHMKQTATDMLSTVEANPYTQAIVLFSQNGNEYGTIIKNTLSAETEETEFLERLTVAKDTEIRYILCVWKGDASIDIPSFAFRKKLFALHSSNAESLMFVMTEDGVSVIKLSATMK